MEKGFIKMSVKERDVFKREPEEALLSVSLVDRQKVNNVAVQSTMAQS
jgi:hypothetical protein